MYHLKLLLLSLLFALLLFVGFMRIFAVDSGALVAHAAAAIASAASPTGGFIADGGAVNAAATNGQSPAVAINGSGDLWTALRQNNQIVVTKFNATLGDWVQQGSSLESIDGSTPTLDFGGPSRNVAWIAWTAHADTGTQIMTARFEESDWQPTGIAAQSGDSPFLVTGATVTDGLLLPWVAWRSTDGIAVKRAVTDTNDQGGIQWEGVGDPLTLTDEAVASQPELAFAGAGSHTPWLAWLETGADGNSSVLSARATIDESAPGGLQWKPVGTMAGCVRAACHLNADIHQMVQHVSLASGALPGETIAKPWIVFDTATADNQHEIRAMRLDDGGTPADPSDDRFIPAGAAINSQCLGDARIGNSTNGGQPDIFFVGTVPHVAWIETQGDIGQLFVCHLADNRSGQERWDLDTIFPINRTGLASAAAPVLATDGNTPYIAWQEGSSQSNVFVAHRYPDGPAWGSNRPPFIRTISWSRNFVGLVGAEAEIAQAVEAISASTNPLTLTTSCDHVGGWDHIQEIQFKVANESLTAFSGKYIAAENKVYVEDPEQPGTLLGGLRPGSNVAPLETAIATLYVADMRVRSHGPNSPALDIDWIISFKEATMFQDLRQMINIVYDDGHETGFFETGLLSFDYRIYLPTVAK